MSKRRASKDLEELKLEGERSRKRRGKSLFSLAKGTLHCPVSKYKASKALRFICKNLSNSRFVDLSKALRFIYKEEK